MMAIRAVTALQRIVGFGSELGRRILRKVLPVPSAANTVRLATLPSSWLTVSARGTDNVMNAMSCMQDRQPKAHVATTDRIHHPACALHRRHACCRVLDIWQAGQLQRQPPALSRAYHPVVRHAARISPIRLSPAPPYSSPGAFAGVVTISADSLHGNSGGRLYYPGWTSFCRGQCS